MTDITCCHKPWRRWPVTHCVARLLFRLRVFNGIGFDHRAARVCLDYVRVGPWVVFDD